MSYRIAGIDVHKKYRTGSDAGQKGKELNSSPDDDNMRVTMRAGK
jgi:hypothetical protein